MGLIAKLLSFVRVQRNGAQLSDVKVNPGGGQNITAEHFAPAGDDSHPLPGDYAYTARTPQAGRYAALGYVDPLNPPKAQAGEKRTYARDADGAVVVEVWLKSTGSAVIDNGSGSVELQPSGAVVINGVTISPNGAVTIPASLTLDGKEIAEHTHPQGTDSAGDTQQDTGPNT